ncbi:hypothetical protein AMTRI_Chr06g190760 [Amborella trichopoda]
MSRLGSANVGSTWLTSARLANIGSLGLTSNLWVEREILEKKQFIRCLKMSSHVNLPHKQNAFFFFLQGGTLHSTKVRLKLMGIQKSGKEKEEYQDLLRFETQDLDDQVLRAHKQNGYIYLQMLKHGVAPFIVRWKVLGFLLHWSTYMGGVLAKPKNLESMEHEEY